MPAQAGIQESAAAASRSFAWIPAFAGMTLLLIPCRRRCDEILVFFFYLLFCCLPRALAIEVNVSSQSFVLPGVSFVDGRRAPELLHQPVSSFRVYTFRDGAPRPIPFQIDERDRRERWTLDLGNQPNANEPAKEFAENNFLVFMNRDLGQRGAFARLPAEARLWAEVRVGGEQSPLGFVYVGVFAQPPPLTCVDCGAARYEEGTDRVYAERYALAFQAPLPTHIAFVEKMGDFGANVVAGVRMVGDIHFLGGLMSIHKTDADLHAERVEYKNGPVRALRRARYWMPLPFGFHTGGRVELFFYRDFVEGTALVKIAIPPRLVLASGELRAYFDFLQQNGARVLLEDGALGEPVDGHMTPGKQSLAERATRWAALLLPDGHVVLFIVRLEGALQRLEQRLYFNDEIKAGESAGGRPRFGFHFTHAERLETGTHRLSVFACVLDNVNIETIHRTANLFLTPPEVVIVQMRSSG